MYDVMVYSQEIFTLSLGGRILIIAICDFATYEIPQENGALYCAKRVMRAEKMRALTFACNICYII